MVRVGIRPVKALGIALSVALIAISVAWLSDAFAARAQEATGFAAGAEVVVNTDGVNLRTDASTSADVQSILPEGAYGVIVSGPTSDGTHSWYLIEVDGISGYVAGEFLAEAGAISTGGAVYVNTDLLNLRDDATTSGGVVAELTAGASATVLSGPVEADGYAWYELDVNGVTGWSVRDYLTLAAPTSDVTSEAVLLANGSTALVNTDALNVRDAAGLSGAVLETLVSGDSVTVTGVSETVDGYEWATIQTAAGTTGWVVAGYLTTDSSDLLLTAGAAAVVATDVLNLRDSASLSGSVLAELPTGEAVTILSASESADGYLWYQAESASGIGWVAGDYLSI